MLFSVSIRPLRCEGRCRQRLYFYRLLLLTVVVVRAGQNARARPRRVCLGVSLLNFFFPRHIPSRLAGERSGTAGTGTGTRGPGRSPAHGAGGSECMERFRCRVGLARLRRCCGIAHHPISPVCCGAINHALWSFVTPTSGSEYMFRSSHGPSLTCREQNGTLIRPAGRGALICPAGRRVVL